MSILNTAIKKVNEQNTLALMIYVIPNFPDPATYQDVLAILHQHPSVTIIETTFPVKSGFSQFANQIIRDAHQQAVQFGDGLSVLASLQKFEKPSVCVLYRETFENIGYDAFLQKVQGKLDGFLFEWGIPNIADYADSFTRCGVELVQCVSHLMPTEKIIQHLSLAIEEPIIYLTSAPMTGAKMFSTEHIVSSIKIIKTHRPKAKIVAGFGIRNVDDIAVLSRVEGIDGVIIGTSFLEVMQQGTRQVITFLDRIASAL